MKKFIALTAMALFVSGCVSNPPKEEPVDYYGQHYQNCLKQSRERTAYTHELMQEETFGHAINNCMEEYGWVTEGKDLN